MKKFIKPFIGLAFIACLTIGIFAGCGDGTAVSAQECLTKLETLNANISTQASPDNYTLNSRVYTNAQGQENTVTVTTKKSGTAEDYVIHNIVTSNPTIADADKNQFIGKVEGKWIFVDANSKEYFTITDSTFDQNLNEVDSYKVSIPEIINAQIPMLKATVESNAKIFKTTVDKNGIYTLKFDFSQKIGDMSASINMTVKFSETNFYSVEVKMSSGEEVVDVSMNITYDTPTVSLPDLTEYTNTDIVV